MVTGIIIGDGQGALDGWRSLKDDENLRHTSPKASVERIRHYTALQLLSAARIGGVAADGRRSDIGTVRATSIPSALARQFRLNM